MLQYFFITNKPDIGRIAEAYGVDRIWIDLETLGKTERQANYDTVKSHHMVEDIGAMKRALSTSEVMVRVNPIHENSSWEIEKVIFQGADVVMLPYFKTLEECERFLEMVNGRARTSLLVETKEAESLVEEIVALRDVDEIHIGLNDLYLSHGKKFLFEMVSEGNVECLAKVLRKSGKYWGFGGIGRLSMGKLPAKYVLDEHYRVGSMASILGRSFCDLSAVTETKEVERIFCKGMAEIREYEEKLTRLVQEENIAYFEESHAQLRKIVAQIAAGV